MKIHIFISGFRNGIIDLDKKLPHVIKTYPDGKIRKTKYNDYDCIIGTNLIKNTKVIKLLDKKIDSTMNIDLYAFERYAHAYFDISFDIDKSLVELLIDKKDWSKSIFIDSTININNEARTLALVLTEHLLPYYDLKTEVELMASLNHDNISTLDDNVDIVLQKTGFKSYCLTSMIGGMSVGNHDQYMIIEDLNNELDVTNSSWENIMPDNDMIYVNHVNSVFVCKKTKFYDDLHTHNLNTRIRPTLWAYARQTCSIFMNTINKKGQDIRKNILDDNRNPYYWKELKKIIEVMDLNFLELHTDIINMTKFNLNHVELKTTIKYKNECEKYLMESAKSLRSDLNEVKYAISNLSTPSHTHDEAILQKETEKVNDRILMLSFIAMAVSALGMIQSDEIDTALKVISGAGIFSLPILYYIVRGFQKRMSIRKNERSELKRQLNYSIKGLENSRKEYNAIADNDEMPDDLKEQLKGFMGQFVDSQEKRVEKLKKKIK